MHKKDYCVYVHKDEFGNIRYVGSGRLKRAMSKYPDSGRGELYKQFVMTHGTLDVEIVEDNLTKEQSVEKEIQLYTDNCNSGYLLNTRTPNKVGELPTKSELDAYFYYDESSPTFLRYKTGHRKGSVAGSLERNGYVRVSYKSHRMMCHRVIMLLHGYEVNVDMVVDHIDGNRSNNSITNLRLTTHAVNNRNASKFTRKQNLPVGVTYDVAMRRIKATVRDPSQLTSSGQSKLLAKRFPLKNYPSFDAAVQAAQEARIEMLKEINERLNLGYSDAHGIRVKE
jgi:hypothetical protein